MDEMDVLLEEKSEKKFKDFFEDFKTATLEPLNNKKLANKDYVWRIKNRGRFRLDDYGHTDWSKFSDL